MRWPRSLRCRLLLSGAIGIAAASFVAAWLLGAAMESSALRALDRQLDVELDHLIGASQWSDSGQLHLRDEQGDPNYGHVFSGWYWQIDAAGQSLQSRSLWDTRLPMPSMAERQVVLLPGPRKQRLRAMTQSVTFPDDRHADYLVAVDVNEVVVEVRGFRWLSAAVMGGIAAILLLACFWQVTFGLRPLARMREVLMRVQAGDDVRFDGDTLPAEVTPLALQVNTLLDQHARQVDRARHAAHDIAHALKTPLAVLTVECSHPDTNFPLKVAEQVGRMRAVIERRLTGSLSADPRQRACVAVVLSDLRNYLMCAYRERGLQIEMAADSSAAFSGSREDLEEMLGNLLDNACKWASSQVVASALVRGTSVWIHIDDDGPGLSVEARKAALSRGVRLDIQVPGSGLGLAIVDDICRSYGGDLRLERSALGGVRAVLILPTGLVAYTDDPAAKRRTKFLSRWLSPGRAAFDHKGTS